MTRLKCTTSAAKAPVWSPSNARIARSKMIEFMARVSAGDGPELDCYDELYQWSIESPEAFWPAVAGYTGMVFEAPWNEVLENAEDMQGARWFVGAELNFAANLLRFSDPRDGNRPAIIARDEAGRRSELSFNGLRNRVAGLARGLRDAGVVAGDCVAGFLPNASEAVIAMLATTSIGAIWSSCSPDFGVNGVLERFGQIRPKVLFATDGYRYGGKRIDTRATVEEIVNGLDTLELTVVVPFLSDAPEIGGLGRAVAWADIVAPDQELRFDPLPFDHPAYIMYSSGTTGVPKCIVHGAGGTLIQHLKEHQLHTDIGPGDRFFFFTTCGWMMWNWLVTGLASGATIVLYDGSPFQPGAGALWRMVDEEQITVFGASAKYFAAMQKSSYSPIRESRLDTLRTLLSTGSPLAPASFDYVYEGIKSDVQLASISGGTDLLGCFALGNPLAPVFRGELQCPGLGMAVEIFDDQGRALPPGEKGELVCSRAFPSMPVGFWDDPDGRLYSAAYFERFPGVWAHGDYAERTIHGGLIIHGRSDAVLNPGGVRIGTAELYREIEIMPEFEDCIAIGQAWKGDTRVVLFVVMRDGLVLDKAGRDQIRRIIRTHLSPRHVPAKIVAVPEIPVTRSGKVSELAVRAVVHGEPVKNQEALANPEALDHFRDLPELNA